jgi:stearoyl-CoA desaturase (delta-9 desaturase)
MLPFWIYYAEWYQLLIGYVCYWFIVDVIQSLFMHRWVSHNSWNCPRFLQKILSIFGVVSLLGTPITYAAWHRTHHAYTDTDKDPHNPVLHGWLHVIFAHYHYAQMKRAVDRLRDKYFQFLTKYMLEFVIIGNLLLFIILPFTWFMTVWAIPVAYNIFNTNFLVLVLSHRTGTVENLPPLYWFLVFSDGSLHKCHHDEPHKLNYHRPDISGYIITKMGWQ